MKKLMVIGLQHSFLRLVLDQLRHLFSHTVELRAVALGELDKTPPFPDETLLYFSDGLRPIVEKMYPQCTTLIRARRENLICNMRDLLSLAPGRRILVVNDIKTNTDEMVMELEKLDLGQTFLPFYPDREVPPDIDLVVAAGERLMVPPELAEKPLLDIGLRFLSLDTVYTLYDHFKLPYSHADLARHYMKTMMFVSEKWPVLGKNQYQKPGAKKRPNPCRARTRFDDLIRKSPAMAACIRQVRKMAATQAPIHLYGRAGTGKSCISEAIHNASPRRQGPFISVNCAARTPETLARELFGWEEDGAVRKSLFEYAQDGTLCIEEIHRLPETIQAGLLQAVTENRIVRTQGKTSIPVKVRLITTSSHSFERRLPKGFDPELILMLTRHICRIPPLAERMEDLGTLARTFLDRRMNKPELILPRDTVDALKEHSWEGNVQELYNVLQHLVCMSDQVLEKSHLPYYITRPRTAAKPRPRPGDAGMFPAAELARITRDITAHGFLEESRDILQIYWEAKVKHQALGRAAVRQQLRKHGISLSQQQLRLKLERMNRLGLLIVRPGRGGTTISPKGESYLSTLRKETDQ